MKSFEPEIESLTLVPSDGGVFEVTANGQNLYSKKQLGRHADPGEVVGLVKKYLQQENRT